MTFTTAGTTPPTLYAVTVTGTGPSTVHQVQVNITVLAVTSQYTLTVTTAISPTTVHAGSGATAVITITPINGYNGSVTPACATISPAATPPPVCSFSPATVAVTNSQPQTTTLTISTSGPPPTGSVRRGRVFYALWLFVPALALAGLSSGGVRRSALLGWVLLTALAAVLLMPGCGSNNSTTTSSSANTPKNTYTFTLTAADANALAPSNASQTVSLTVN